MLDIVMDFFIDTEKYPECKPLVAQAQSLIESGKAPSIQITGVPFSVRDKRPFKQLRMKILERYRNPYYAVGNCIHEGAHAVLNEEEGVPNVRFSGPGIQYDRASRHLFPYGARIDSDPQPDLALDEHLVFRTTTILAAGGVALKKYAGMLEVGDDQDYKQFRACCTMTPELLRGKAPEDLWRRGKQNAATRLDRPETKSKILAKVPLFLAQLYA